MSDIQPPEIRDHADPVEPQYATIKMYASREDIYPREVTGFLPTGAGLASGLPN